jgi:hypothetical protein
MAFVARLWAALSLTLVGRVHIAKQVLAAKLAYHFSFLNPSPAQLTELTGLVDHFAARSMHAEDASLRETLLYFTLLLLFCFFSSLGLWLSATAPKVSFASRAP